MGAWGIEEYLSMRNLFKKIWSSESSSSLIARRSSLPLHLIRLIGVIVPQRLRRDWRQEWESELRSREALLAEWERLDWKNRLDLLWRSTSAFWDALWLQPQRLEDDLYQDLRFGARMLRKNPGLTLIAVLTLALGIGASTAIFSAVNPILFEPLPYPQASRIAMIWDRGGEGARLDLTFGTYRELSERNRTFDALAVMRVWQPTMTGPAEPERLIGQRVSASYFHILGVPPVLGRDFARSDDQVNGPKVVILSDGIWQRRFARDETIIGRQIKLDDNNYTVIGVMPKTFENVLAPKAEVWTPLQYDASLPSLQGREWGHHLRAIGRLRSEVVMSQANRDLDTIAYDQIPQFSRAPWAMLAQGFIVNSLQAELTRGVKPALLAILGAVLLVLAIACVNVTNLLLARGAQRRGEFTLRAALGAGRTRMIRQLLTESLLLSTIGGALGMIVAQFGILALIALSPAGLPRLGAIHLDAAVFGFGLAVTTLIGLVVGLIPALDASRSDIHLRLQQSSGRTAGGHQLTRRVLVVAEVALALVLLVGAGLLLRSLQQLFSIAPGFDPSDVLTLQVQTSGHRFADDRITHRFFAQAQEAVLRVPGVTDAAFTNQLPMSGDFDVYGVHFELFANEQHTGGEPAHRYAVTPGYFKTLGIPLRLGRLLDARDVPESPKVVLINESFARRIFAGRDPLGQRLRVGGYDGPLYTIVGVVGDVRQMSLAVSPEDAVYMPTTQWRYTDRALSLVVKTRGNAASLAPFIRQVIWLIDKDQPIVRIATMDELLTASASERRFALILFETFGLVALILAASGIYGVFSGSVAERTREIGVRLAMGAQRWDVLGLILKQGIQLTIIGVVIGLIASWAVTRFLTNLLYEVRATDPLVFAGVALLLMVVSLLACYIPARRATRVDPLIALRHE
jgi:putative ABC transport system permease protein